MNERIPLSWKRLPLSALSQRIRRRNTIGNKNVLTISAIHGLVNQRSFFNKIVASKDLSNYFLLNKGEFAYNKSYSTGYPVGVVRKLDRYDTGVLSPLYICFGMSSRNVDTNYAQYFFDSQSFIDEINDIAKEGARNHGLLNVGVEDFFNLSFILPPLPEQKKIATILSSVDEVIEKTRAQIEKLKDLKTGMMQELLTKGIGHTEFKDSLVGRIPVEWQHYSIGELSSFVTSGSRGWAQFYAAEGPIFIRIGNLTRQHINLKFDDVVHVNPPNSAEGRRTKVQPDDLLISITADLGIIGVINSSIDQAYVNQHISLVRLEKPEISRWLGHYLAFENTQKQFIANNDSGAKAGLNLNAIRNTIVSLPPPQERDTIVSILDGIDSTIEVQQSKLNHVCHLKKSLMQDLLTGKVRVNVNQEEAATA